MSASAAITLLEGLDMSFSARDAPLSKEKAANISIAGEVVLHALRPWEMARIGCPAQTSTDDDDDDDDDDSDSANKTTLRSNAAAPSIPAVPGTSSSPSTEPSASPTSSRGLSCDTADGMSKMIPSLSAKRTSRISVSIFDAIQVQRSERS